MNKVKANSTLSLPGRWRPLRIRDIGEIVDFDLDDNYWNTYADSVRTGRPDFNRGERRGPPVMMIGCR
jgi:hypothetical protein